MSFVQNNWLLILVFVLSGAMLALAADPEPAVARKGRRHLEVTRLINSSNAVLLDIRETKEYEGGRLPNAIHIPLSQLASRGGELARYAGKPIVVYCMTGNRSPDGERRAGAPRLQGCLQSARRLQGVEGRGAARWRSDVPTVTMYSTAVCPYCIQA